MNIKQTVEQINFENLPINKFELFQPFIEAYHKVSQKASLKYKLFYQYKFGKEEFYHKKEDLPNLNKQHYEFKNGKIIYWFNPEVFIGYRWMKNSGFVPLFVSCREDDYIIKAEDISNNDIKTMYNITGYSSSYDLSECKFYHRKLGLIKPYRIYLKVEQGGSFDNISLYESFQNMAKETLKHL